MRKDMAKVIVERPRNGGGGRERKARDLEEEPLKQGMKYRLSDPKRLNENLQPLRRYIASQVGRPWSKVYSEISANLKATNAVQQHVRDHLKDFVNVTADVNKKHAEFYVDPRDGILKKDKEYARARKRRKRMFKEPQGQPDIIKLSIGSDLRRLKGIWFAVSHSFLETGEIIDQKRQLSTKELRERNLVNDNRE